MFDKKHDDFFDENKNSITPEKELLTMIDKYDKPLAKNVEIGSKVTGKILSIGKQYAFVDINAKNEAMIKIEELMDEHSSFIKNAGDAVEAYIVSATHSEIMLSTVFSNRDKHTRTSLSELVSAMKNKVPIEGKVTGVNKGGFNVRIMGQKAFCPVSQIDLKYVEDQTKYLNASLSFVITQITEGGKNIVVSRIPLLQQDLQIKLDDLKKGIAEKTVYNGTISRITPFGLFVDIGEVEGLVHISEVSWERANDLEKSFSAGQKVECVVLGIEQKEPLRLSKISLSLKQVGANPWTEVSERFRPGQSVEGKITKCASFGAFVQLSPGVEGLIHVSEMSWGKRVRHPSDVVTEGQTVRVTILSIDEKKKEISCSLKDLDADPWRDVDKKMPVGSTVTGTVAQHSRFGYFVDLAEGITGLLPFANVAADKKETIKVGSPLDVVVETVDGEKRRISLSHGTIEVKQQASEVREYLNSQAGQAKPLEKTSPQSEFAEALKMALRKKGDQS
jgi:small subunit ribosomal protein S1